VFGVNMALFQVSFARRAALKQELQLSQALANAQQAQLAALRYQLNPHFLFNALNSISALIVTKRNEDAERMTDKLSSFLRSSLNADPGELVPLEEELALTEEYLDIESVRFGERLERRVDCAPMPARRWSRASSSSRWSKTRSSTASPAPRDRDRDHIRPMRSAASCASASPIASADAEERSGRRRPGVGLANVRRRLEAVYGKAASLDPPRVEDGRYVATISIPVASSRELTGGPPRPES
jgi:sensor histidine kinase YesM